jgi:hypothetical protein
MEYTGKQLIKENDVLLIIDFKQKVINKRILHLAKDSDDNEGSIAFYKEDNKTIIGGFNKNVFAKPSLFNKSKYIIKILEKDTKAKKLLDIFNWFCNNELGIDDTGNYAKYIGNTNIKKISVTEFLNTLS